jgi:uncharacterized PurR-regulated membrane protein YhhQ (DUF165 family)
MLVVCLYLIAVVLANLSVTYFGPISTPINAFLLIAFDLVTRDYLHERWEHNKLWLRMFLLIVAGGIISSILNFQSLRVAVASCISFILVGFTDTIVYHLFRKHPRMKRVTLSNIASSIVDSVAFPTLAFGEFLLWVTVGQSLAKIIGGYLWTRILTATIWKDTPNKVISS